MAGSYNDAIRCIFGPSRKSFPYLPPAEPGLPISAVYTHHWKPVLVDHSKKTNLSLLRSSHGHARNDCRVSRYTIPIEDAQ